MSDLNPNPETLEAAADPADPEGLDAAAEAFAKKAQPEENEAEAESESEEASDSTEADEADPEADESEEPLVELEIDGKTYQVPEELQKGYLRQSDYSRKMNEVSAKEKAFAERIEQADRLVEGAEKYAGALSNIKVLEAELQQLNGVDIDALERTDPQQAAQVAVRQLRLEKALRAAVDEAKSIGRQVHDEKAQAFESARGDMFKALEKDLKGWSDDMGAKLTQYATTKGVQLKTLQTLTDPAIVVALDKARRFDELQASKETIKAKAKDAPRVVKPGAPRKPDAKADAMARLRKDNSIDAAAAAFLARGR